MNSIRKIYTCRLTTLTPAHIGSGNLLRANIDFIADRSSGRITALNMNKIFSHVESMDSAAVSSFSVACDSGDIGGWFRKNRLRPDDYAYFVSSVKREDIPREIRQLQRNGFGIPYFPGSSIKGALRTAIIHRLSGDTKAFITSNVSKMKHDRVRHKFADNVITKRLLGSDPNHSIMRCMSVGDAFFHDSRTVLGVSRIASMRNGGGYSYKRFPIVVESIRSKETAVFELGFDTFLCADDKRDKLEYSFKLDFAWLRKAVLDLSRKLIEREKIFCEQKLEHNELTAYYKYELPEIIKSLSDNEIVFNLGWGIGWEGMTGGLIEMNLRQDAALRKNLKLAPHRLDAPFPKTRKIAELDSRITPWGWVQIRFDDHDRSAVKTVTAEKTPEVPVQSKDEKKPEQQKPKEPGEDLMVQIDALATSKIAGSAAEIVKKIRELDDPSVQSKAAERFIDRLDKKARKKAQEKAWYQELMKLIKDDQA